MKTIPLKDALELIENASAIIVNGNALMYPATSELTGEPDNEFLFVTWNDGDYDFEIVAREGDNQTVKVNDAGELVLVAAEGNEFEITILKMNVVQV